MATEQNDLTKQQLHKPPVLLFFLPLVLIIIYAFFSR